MTVYEGSICGCEADDKEHRFLVEEGGIIRFVGDSLPEAYAKAPRVDLGSKALSPCFVDSHIHFSSFALFHSGLDLLTAVSNEEVLERVRQSARAGQDGGGKIMVGFGLSPHAVREGRLPTRAELDAATGAMPAFLVKYDGHAALANTALLEKAPGSLSSERGYDAGSGLIQNEAFYRGSFKTRTSFERATIAFAEFVAFHAISMKCEKLQSQFQN
jgi:hypothetical protein